MKIDKEAVISLRIIIEIVMVLALSAVIVSAAYGYGNSEFVQKQIHAENIRLMINTLIGVPGDAVLKYPYDAKLNISTYSFLLYNDRVTVMQGAQDGFAVIRAFSLPSGYTSSSIIKEARIFCIEKNSKRKEIMLRDCKEGEFAE